MGISICIASSEVSSIIFCFDIGFLKGSLSRLGTIAAVVV